MVLPPFRRDTISRSWASGISAVTDTEGIHTIHRVQGKDSYDVEKGFIGFRRDTISHSWASGISAVTNTEGIHTIHRGGIHRTHRRESGGIHRTHRRESGGIHRIRREGVHRMQEGFIGFI